MTARTLASIVCLCVLAASCAMVKYSPAPESGVVVRWIDGDTCEIAVDDCTVPDWTERVRIYGVDTPERNEPGFDEATKASCKQWPPGSRVRLEYPETKSNGSTRYRDNFGRLLATLTTR